MQRKSKMMKSDTRQTRVICNVIMYSEFKRSIKDGSAPHRRAWITTVSVSCNEQHRFLFTSSRKPSWLLIKKIVSWDVVLKHTMATNHLLASRASQSPSIWGRSQTKLRTKKRKKNRETKPETRGKRYTRRQNKCLSWKLIRFRMEKENGMLWRKAIHLLSSAFCPFLFPCIFSCYL